MAHKALSAFFSLRMFLSSIIGLSPYHLRHIYISCVVPILFYRFQLWYNSSSPPKGLILLLQKTQNKCLVKIAGVFKTTPTPFFHNFLSIPYISDLLHQRYFKYSHFTYTSCPSSFWPRAILNSSYNKIFLNLTPFYSNHATFFTKASICSLPPSSSPLAISFPSRFIISNKAGILGKNRDKFINNINSSLSHSPSTLFFFTDRLAMLKTSVVRQENKLYWQYRNITGSAVLMYFQGKLIGSRHDQHSTASTAFNAEIFAIVKTLQLLQARLQATSSSNEIPFDKVVLYSDFSSSLKLLEKNPSSFLHHPAYIQVFKIVMHILSTFPFISISLNWCSAHKGIIGN